MGGGARGEMLPHRSGRQKEQCKNNENKIQGCVNWPSITKSTQEKQPKEVVLDRGEYEEGA